MKQLLFPIFLLFFSACGIDTQESTVEKAPQVTNKQQPLLVIRLEYDNQLFVNDASIWAKKIFGHDEHQLNHYLQEVSNNDFSFTPVLESDRSSNSSLNDGVVTIHLHKNHPNSGASPSIHSDLKVALEGIDKFVNFRRYDRDNSGSLSFDEITLIFIVAGAEGSYAEVGKLNSVWAHQSCVSRYNIKVDSLVIAACKNSGSYALFGERHIDGIIPTHDATIGIIAHELGHALFNLPDLYPTAASVSSSGIGYFGLMGGGLWAYNSIEEENRLPGNTPSHFCAWSKVYNGWFEPELITSNTTFSLPSTSSSHYKIMKMMLDSDEYLLFENRAIDGYDSGLFAVDGVYRGGLAIWHINETILKNASPSNSVQNSEEIKGVDLVEAKFANIDSTQSARGHAKNLFYDVNVDTLSISATVKIKDISAPSDVMTFNVEGLE